MDIKAFKKKMSKADEAEMDELCLNWLYDFAWECDKRHIALILEVVADKLGIDVQPKDMSCTNANVAAKFPNSEAACIAIAATPLKHKWPENN